MSDHYFNIVVLGNSGVGKSALMNYLAGKKDAFLVGNTSETGTTLTQSQKFKLFGGEDGINVRLVDTQGLSDTGGDKKDMEHIRNMVNSIRELKKIDLFLLCLDSVNPRFTPYLHSTVELFTQIFPDFLKHAVLVFNKWTMWDEARQKDLIRDYQKQFETRFGIKQIPCYFVDSFCNLEITRDNPFDGRSRVCALHQDIQKRSRAQVIGMVSYMGVKNSSCDVSLIKEAKTRAMMEREKLLEAEEMIKKQQREAAEQKKIHEKQQREKELEIERLRAQEHNNFLKNFVNGAIDVITWGHTGPDKDTAKNFVNGAADVLTLGLGRVITKERLLK